MTKTKRGSTIRKIVGGWFLAICWAYTVVLGARWLMLQMMHGAAAHEIHGMRTVLAPWHLLIAVVFIATVVQALNYRKLTRPRDDPA